MAAHITTLPPLIAQQAVAVVTNTTSSTNQHYQKPHHHHNHSKQSQIFKSLISGGIAGACAKSVIAPFERVKLLFITRDRHFSYKEATKEAIYLVKTHGIKNMWRGNSANIMRIFPLSGINFSVFDHLRKTYYNPFPNEHKGTKRLLLFSIGAISGVIGQTICYPFEFLRTRMAMERDHFTYKNISHSVSTIYRKEGILSFYSGLSLGIVGVIFYHGCGFYLVTSMKQHLKQTHSASVNKWYMDFIVGAVGATISQLISYPFDLMKKRKQAQSLLVANKEQPHLMSYKELIAHYIRKEGAILTFYKGISMNLIKGPLASGMAWMVKNQLNRQWDKSYDL